MTDLRDHHGLDLARMGNVRADTQVDHRTTSVYSRGCTIGYLRFDDVFLVLVVLCRMRLDIANYQAQTKTYREHLEKRLFGYYQPLEFLLLLNNGISQLFEGGIVCVRDRPK